jgi:4-aminobutyrate aminotransferase-like enzyme
MYGPDDQAYLDVYNNVPVVGHCHPHVVEALARQSSVLNTHTRYLTDKPIELAEQLLATFPAELATAIFTCTGSESNDLAIRVSKAVTGGTGVIVSDWAYHGTTETLAGMSPSSGTGRLGPHVYTVPAPIDEKNATQFASRVQVCIEAMRVAGVKPAALLVDTIFASDGVAADPPGFLAAAAAHMRAAGGLFIADEVQSHARLRWRYSKLWSARNSSPTLAMSVDICSTACRTSRHVTSYSERFAAPACS